MNLKMIHNYKNHAGYRNSFNALARKTFCIDFEKWYETHFWNDRYICFSFVDGDKVVSNVSANLLNWVVQGKRLNAIQIGTVMTDPDYRKKGLASQLMQQVLSTYENHCDLFYLFGEPSVRGFYESFGYTPIQETAFHTKLSATGKRNGCFRRLNLTETADLDIVRRLTTERAPLSEHFWVDNAQSILAWHLLNVYPEEIFYIEHLDAIVLFQADGPKLQLSDVVCSRAVDLEELVDCLVPQGEVQVNVRFTPGQPQLYSQIPYVTDDYVFFVKTKDNSLLPDTFFHPDTAHA